MVLEGRGASGARTSRDSIPKSEVKISAGPQMEKSAMRDGDGEFSNSEWLSKPLKSHRADKFQGRMRETMSDNSDSSRASWPILLGGFPVVANILFSGSNQWVEVAIIIMIMVWIYYILQTPWDLFMKSRRLRYNVSERFFILMIFASPLIAAYSIQVARTYLGSRSTLLAGFSIPLFLCVAFLRPIMFFLRESGESVSSDAEIQRLRHNVGMLLDRIEHLERPHPSNPEVVHYNTGQNMGDLERYHKKQLAAVSDRLNRRIDELERCINEIRVQAAPATMDNFRDSLLHIVFVPLTMIWNIVASILFLPMRIVRKVVSSVLPAQTY